MEMKTFRVHFSDGNQKLLEAENIYNAISYICWELNIPATAVVKIEEV